MAKSASPPPGDPDKKIANADWLMNDPPASSPKAKPAKPKPKSAPPAPASSADSEDHSYDVVGGDDDLFTVDEPDAPPSPVPVPVPRPAAPETERKPKSKPKIKEEWEVSDEDVATFDAEDEDSQVDQVWSRGAEWGSHLFFVGLAAAVVIFGVYKAIAAIQFLLAVAIFVFGGVALLVICYPIFITLERPVRITPEQAAKDYFAMLSYPWPFYPRMWLLLSNSGRAAPEFSSYSQFKSYWKKKLAAIQGGRAAFPNPLRFKVESFASEKSAGQTTVHAKYTLKVFKGEPGSGNKEIASYAMATNVIKGPDRMWYLGSGTLPTERR
jgi:hypothetical protein